MADVRRFIDESMRWCEQYPARGRRGLRIRAPDGPDIDPVEHTRFLPARRGHDGDALQLSPWLHWGVPAVVLRTALAVGVRMLWRWSMQARVDTALAVAARAAHPRPKLRRVK